jgi:AraC-like DNA-binding protein
MSFKAYEPAFPLRRYVDFLYRVDPQGAPPSRRRIYPDGAMQLVIHLQSPAATFFLDDRVHTIRAPLIAGPYSRSFEIDPSKSGLIIGVQFRPGAAHRFHRIAAHELSNTDISLGDLNRAEADGLLNRICSAASEHAQFRVVEEYLRDKLALGVETHPAIDYAVEQFARLGGSCGIGKIQVATGLSHTRFIQLFREQVGLTPKLYCRVRRFRRLMDKIQKGMPVNWAELAADCGYFDQAHLIRDFRVFAGTTPVVYRQGHGSAD